MPFLKSRTVDRAMIGELGFVKTESHRRIYWLWLLAIALLASACGGRVPLPTPATGALPTPTPPPQVGEAPARRSLQGTRARFDRYNLEQGLSQSVAECVLQDSRGFLWVGTEDGLNRFDGYGFKIYRHDPDDPHSLGTNTILSLYEDRSGMLWIGTYLGGLDRFDPATERFTHYRHDPDDANTLGHDAVRSLLEDSRGALWVGTEGGLDRFDPGTGRWDHYRHDEEDENS